MNQSLLPDIDYANHPAYRDIPEMADADVRACRANYDEKLFHILNALRPHVEFWSSRVHGSIDGPWKDFAKDGIAAHHLPPQLKSEAKDLFDRYLSGNGEDSEDCDTVRFTGDEIKSPANIELRQFLHKTVKSTSLLPAISAYLSNPQVIIKTVHFKRHRSAGENRDFPFPDLPEIAGPGAGLHIDVMPQAVKAMIYISPVEKPEDGPFRYVPGSQSETQPILDFAVRRATSWHVPGVDRESRQRLMALPEMYRKKTNFGNDLLTEASDLKSLLDAEETYYSTKGDCVLFDPAGIHRGNDVRGASPREVIQITFQGR